MKIYTRKYPIVNSEMQQDYRLSVEAIATYFQDSVASYFATQHIAAFDIVKQQLMWIISEYKFDIIDELPYWSEEVVVRIWVSEISSLRIYFDFEILHKNRMFAHGDSSWSILDIATRKPVLLNEVIKSSIEPLSKFVLDNHKHRITSSSNVLQTVEYQTNNGDKDFNGHVNNRAYLRVVLNSLPLEYMSKHDIKSLTIKYMRESFAGDVLLSQIEQTENPNEYIYVISRKSDLQEACRVLVAFTERKSQISVSDYDLQSRRDYI